MFGIAKILALVGEIGTLRKLQNLNYPKNHEYDGEINETWDNYFWNGLTQVRA